MSLQLWTDMEVGTAHRSVPNQQMIIVVDCVDLLSRVLVDCLQTPKLLSRVLVDCLQTPKLLSRVLVVAVPVIAYRRPNSMCCLHLCVAPFKNLFQWVTFIHFGFL